MFKSYTRKGKLPKKSSGKKSSEKKTCKIKSSEKKKLAKKSSEKNARKKSSEKKNRQKKSSEKVQKFDPLKVQKFLNFASRLQKEALFCSEMEFRKVKVFGGVV